MARSTGLGLLALAALALWAAALARGAGTPASSPEAPRQTTGSAEERAAAPTFTANVGALVHRSCSPCHREGGSGPFPLVTFEEVRRRAKQIAIVTETRFMPPWKPAPGYGRFHDERRLTPREVELFADWAAAGAPLGDPEALPAPPEFPDGWLLGPPDLILTMEEPYVVPPEGKDDYRTFVLPSHLEQERFARAFDFRPDNPPPVHHVITLLDESGSARELDEHVTGVGYEGMVAQGELFGNEIHGWGPGATPRFLPEGSAWRLAPGVDFVLDTHFQTTGKPEPVRIAVGVYLAESEPEAPMFNISLSSTSLCIPPGMADYTARWSFELPVPVTAVSIQPHAHYVGKDLWVRAVRPDGTRLPLIRIPDWDFAWQDSYRYVEPIPLDAGTVLEMEYVFDNSSTNERNPFSPPRRIISGPSSSDEMALLWMQVAVAPAHRDSLYEAVLQNQRDVEAAVRLPDELFRGVIYGFDGDGDGMLSIEEDQAATAYMNALPEHPHAMAFDLDRDGSLEESERALLKRSIARWNGEHFPD